MAKGLELHLQQQSILNVQGWSPLGLTGLIPLQSKGLSRVFSRTRIWKHQFFSAQPSLWSNSHIHTWLLEKTWSRLYGPLLAKWCLCFLICCLCVCLVTQSCPFLCKPMNCSPPGSSVHRILQARILELGCHSLLQRIFLTLGSNLGILNCEQILYYMSYRKVHV